ncbi:MAG: hypothetical protein U7123_23705 [Potamolinea sp.]
MLKTKAAAKPKDAKPENATTQSDAKAAAKQPIAAPLQKPEASGTQPAKKSEPTKKADTTTPPSGNKPDASKSKEKAK